jgi:hypothetical protein
LGLVLFTFLPPDPLLVLSRCKCGTFFANLQGGHISIERQKRLVGNTYEDKYKNEDNITRFLSKLKLEKTAIIEEV